MIPTNTIIGETTYFTPIERRVEERKGFPALRFEFNGNTFTACDWSSYGFKINTYELSDMPTGEDFVIRGIGYGRLKMIPVLIKAKVMRNDDGQLAAKFLHVSEQAVNAFDSFVARSLIQELQMAAA